MAGEIAGVQSAVQDFRNKTLIPMQNGQAPSMGPTETPGLPSTGGASAGYANRMMDAQQQSLSSHGRLTGAIQQKVARTRALAGQGSTAASTRAVAGLGSPMAGMNAGNASKSAGGWGGAYGLQKNAAAALARMSAAYQARWGTGLVVNSGGRSYQEQAQLYAAYKAGRGNLAAPPGTSVHESGRAVDLGGAILNASSAQHQWLQSVASQYGFVWTGKNFSQFEPWHWEYHGS